MKRGNKVIYNDRIFIIHDILEDKYFGKTFLIYNPNEYKGEFLNDVLPKKTYNTK